MANGILVPSELKTENISSTYSAKRDGDTIVLQFNNFEVVNGEPKYSWSLSSEYLPKEMIYAPILVTMASPTHVIGYIGINILGDISVVIPSNGSYALPTGSIYGAVTYIV